MGGCGVSERWEGIRPGEDRAGASEGGRGTWADEDWRCIRKRDRAVTSEEGRGRVCGLEPRLSVPDSVFPALDISPNL